MSNVFIALQTNEETRPIIDAIIIDNPNVTINRQPAMVKIDSEGRLTVRRETIEEQLGRAFDLQELQINLISISGHVDETDDEFTLTWNS